MVSGLFDVVLRVGGSWEREALGIQRSILELELDRFSASEVAHTILCLDSKSGDDASCCVLVGMFWCRSRGACLVGASSSRNEEIYIRARA